MVGIEISNKIEYTDVVPEEFQITLRAKQKFLAFSPISKLISTSKRLNVLGDNLELGLTNYSPTVKMIPLHNFTVSNIPKNIENNYEGSFLDKLFKLLFTPQRYFNSADAKNFSQLSPLVQIIRSENNYDIFKNPAIEAAINYKWCLVRSYFLRLFFVYILFAICFAVICGTYVAHLETAGHLCNFLLFLMILFYYLGYYLLVVEYRQLEHHGWTHYFDFFNCVDLASVVMAIIVMSVYIIPSFSTENTFANVLTTQGTTVTISFTMLLLWFEFVSILYTFIKTFLLKKLINLLHLYFKPDFISSIDNR